MTSTQYSGAVLRSLSLIYELNMSLSPALMSFYSQVIEFIIYTPLLISYDINMKESTGSDVTEASL